MSSSQAVIDQIRMARLYTKSLLSPVEGSDWFRQPVEGVTHVAWQVGHLAVTQYNLGLRRVRGEKAEDADLLPPKFSRLFGKGSTPLPDPAEYPTPEDIRAVFERVHRQVIGEIAALPDETLSEAVGEPAHPMFKTKLGALQWCVHHEFVHAGQIALLRRLFGAAPLR